MSRVDRPSSFDGSSRSTCPGHESNHLSADATSPQDLAPNAGACALRWLPRHQRACPSAGLDGEAKMPPPLYDVNRFMRMERYIFIRYHQLRDEPHTCALLGPSRWRASARTPHRPARTRLGICRCAADLYDIDRCAAALALDRSCGHDLARRNDVADSARTRRQRPITATGMAGTCLAWGLNPLVAGPELDVVPGDPQAHPQPVHYQLPFREVPVQVDQGLGGYFSHTDRPNWCGGLGNAAGHARAGSARA